MRLLDGAKVQRLRKQAGFTTTNFAYLIGRTERQVRHYENGRYQPPIEVVERMAGLLHVPVEELYKPLTRTAA